MRPIIWSPEARRDLNDIAEWLDDNRGVAVSARVLTAIYARAAFLRDFPHGGRPNGEHYRVLRVLGTPYLILYRLTAVTTEIIRVHHERQDWPFDA